jgi:hypothetical protein
LGRIRSTRQFHRLLLLSLLIFHHFSLPLFVVLVGSESHVKYHAHTSTGYKRKLKKHYTSPVQEAAKILRNQEGADSVDMAGKVVVVTGYVPVWENAPDCRGLAKKMAKRIKPSAVAFF